MFCTLALALPDAARANEASQQLVKDARELMRTAPQEPHKILAKLKAATAADPRDGRAWFIYGAYLQSRQLARAALPLLNKAAAIDPAMGNVHFYRGRALADLGRSKEALAIYAQETNKDGNPLFSFYRGLAHQQMKQYPAALADFDRSDETYPAGRQATQLRRAEIFAAQRKRAEAAAAYEAAVRLDAGSPVAETARERLKAYGRRAAVSQPASDAAADCSEAEAHWLSAEAKKTLALYEDHLARFPGCAFATLAKARVEVLKK